MPAGEANQGLAGKPLVTFKQIEVTNPLRGRKRRKRRVERYEEYCQQAAKGPHIGSP